MNINSLPQRSFYLIILLILIFKTPLQASPMANIAVLDFSSQNFQKSHALVVRERIEYILFQSGLFNILERKRIELLTREYQIVTGLSDKNTDVIKIGKVLSTDYVITGEISKSDRLVISIRVTDIQSGMIVYADHETMSEEVEVIQAAEKLGNGIIIFFKKKPITTRQKVRLRISLNAGYLQPMSDLENVVNDGFTTEASIGLEDLLIRSLTTGIHVNHMQFQGRGSTSYAAITSLMFEADYAISLPFTEIFFIEPLIAGGASYVFLKQDGKVSGSPEPVISAGFSLQYRAGRTFMVTAGFRHMSLIERTGFIHYCSFTGGIGYIFNFYR